MQKNSAVPAGTALDNLIKQIEDKPIAMARLAHVLRAKGESRRAHELCARALALAPEDGEVRAFAMEVFSVSVPDWHFWILDDAPRNEAHQAALRSAVRPGFRVLEIGAGTGLFAMMAARAGADEVLACEANANVAAAAAEVVARNGFQDRVKVAAKHSSDLQIGTDISGPADVLLLGNASNNLIGDGILPALEQSVRRLLRRGGQVIPSAGTIRVGLADDREFGERRLGTVEGFDLTPFNRLTSHCYQIRPSRTRFALRSEPGDLFRFDFQSGGPFPEDRASTELASHGGCVNGVAQWIRLDMDPAGRYENAPWPETRHAWGVMFYPFSSALETSAGDKFAVCGAHDRASLRIWAKKL